MCYGANMEYKNDTGLPSVTTILSPFVDKRWFKDKHRIRGQQVHGFISAGLKKMFVPAIPDDLAPYVESSRQITDHIDEILLIEKRMVDKTLGYCGQMDLIARMDESYQNKIAVIDWKTSVAEGKTWGAQLGAYANLAMADAGIKCDMAMAVRLRRESGRKALVSLYEGEKLLSLQNVFKAALVCYKNLI